MERSHNYTYKITNNINNKYYYGVHCTDDLDDGYMGSGKLLKVAFKKYGAENFTKVILEFFDTAAEAYEREAELVTMKEVNDPMCYNIKRGGEGGREKIFTDEELREHKREQDRRYQQNNKDSLRIYYREERREYRRQYNRDNREGRAEYMKEYHQINKDQLREYQHEYDRINKERKDEYLNEYRKTEKYKAYKREYDRKYYQRKKQQKLNIAI